MKVVILHENVRPNRASVCVRMIREGYPPVDKEVMLSSAPSWQWCVKEWAAAYLRVDRNQLDVEFRPTS